MTIRLLVGTALVVGSAGSLAMAQDKAQIDHGMKVYADNKCSVCHSIAGKGNAKGPLDAVGSKLTAEEIRQWLINAKVMAEKTKSTRKPPMPSYAKLSKPDLEALIAYLGSLKKK